MSSSHLYISIECLAIRCSYCSSTFPSWPELFTCFACLMLSNSFVMQFMHDLQFHGVMRRESLLERKAEPCSIFASILISSHIILYVCVCMSKHIAQHVYICVYLTSSLQHFVRMLLFRAAVSTVAFGTIKSASRKRTSYESRKALHSRRICRIS